MLLYRVFDQLQTMFNVLNAKPVDALRVATPLLENAGQ